MLCSPSRPRGSEHREHMAVPRSVTFRQCPHRAKRNFAMKNISVSERISQAALGAAIGLLLASCGGGDSVADASGDRAHPLSSGLGQTIAWTPVSITDTANPGSRQVIPVTLTASTNITNLTISVVPALQNVVSVSPTSFASLQKGQVVTLTLSVAPPANAPLGMLQGTIHARDGNSTLASPLAVTIALVIPEVINGTTVPPEPPPELNNATLAGFDADGNGVRDDVDRNIAKVFGGTPDYAYMLAYARAYQAMLTSPTPANRDEALGTYSTVICATRGAGLAVMNYGMTQIVVNTNIRKTARSRFADVLLGLSPEELTPCAN